ncbi:hypothetical protein KDA08_02580 [Candidatus Saccharibacteria bacterium]|nr:hypothetical protein [Candidatus Saccharibacteria bacterium]
MAHQNRWSGQILSISEKPIISVKEARKILGKEYDNVSDDNLMGIIKSLTQIANYYLDVVRVPKIA